MVDINSDGLDDIYFETLDKEKIVVLTNQDGQSFTVKEFANPDPQRPLFSLNTGQLDDDKELEFYATVQNNIYTFDLANDAYTASIFTTLDDDGNNYYRAHLADIEGDGDLDFILYTWDDDSALYRNDESTFTRIPLPGNNLEGFRQIRDLNGDGFLDPVVMRWDGETAQVYFYDGDQSFEPVVLLDYYEGYRTMDVVDVDGDGDYDIVMDSYDSGSQWVENTGNKTFIKHDLVSSGGILATRLENVASNNDQPLRIFSAISRSRDADINISPIAARSYFVSGGQTRVAIESAGDPNGNTVIYRIAGGVDAEAFTYNKYIGELVFKTAPDFNVAADENSNNRYSVILAATDGYNEISRHVFVTVVSANLTDTDGDGVENQNDLLPFDPYGSNDTDNDGISDASDQDNDNDGVQNNVDNAPYDS